MSDRELNELERLELSIFKVVALKNIWDNHKNNVGKTLKEKKYISAVKKDVREWVFRDIMVEIEKMKNLIQKVE